MASIIEQFVEWEKDHRHPIEHVQSLLGDRLSGEPEELIRDLQDAEAWSARIGELLANANSWLDGSKQALKLPREAGSESDRKIELDSLVAPIRLVRDRLESLEGCLKQRLILGMSLLSYHRQFKEHRVREESLQGNASHSSGDPF